MKILKNINLTQYIKWFLPVISLLHGQSDFSFKNISVKDGLSESTVKVILEDYNGFLYFGTENGLDVYNGYEFTNYHMDSFNDTSMLGNRVSYLYEDSNKLIWVGTELGISVFDPVSKQFSRPIEIDNKISISSFEPRTIVDDRQGNIWINLVENNILLYFRPEENQIECLNCLDGNKFFGKDVNVLFKDEMGIVWFGIDTFLYYLNNSTMQIEQLKWNGTNVNQKVNVIAQGDSAIVWFGTEKGLIQLINGPGGKIKFYKKDGQSNSIVSNMVSDLSWDRNRKKLWIATQDGFSCFFPKEEKFNNIQVTPFENSIIENDIKKILLASKSGRVWYTTNNHPGINCLSITADSTTGINDTSVMHFIHDPVDPVSIADNDINCFIEDKSGHVWIGTGQNGISFHSFFKPKFISFKYDQENEWGLKSNKIYSMTTDSYNMIWAATSYGLEYLSSDGIRDYDYDKINLGLDVVLDVEVLNNDVNLMIATNKGIRLINTDTDEMRQVSSGFIYDLEITNTGQIIAGTDEGIIIIDTLAMLKGSDSFKNSHSWSLPVRVIRQDNWGNLWMGTDKNGLFRLSSKIVKKLITSSTNSLLDVSNNYTYNSELKSSISSSAITCITEDNSGKMWIGTNSGLNQYRQETDDFIHYFVKDGLPSNYITGIVVDQKNNLWISSKKGISLFDQESKKFKNYGLEDGTGNIDFHRNSYTNSSDGNIYFGGPNGITKFNSIDIQYNDHKPNCVITKIKKTSYSDTVSEAFLSSNHRESLDGHLLTIDHRDKSFTIDFVALNYHQTRKNQYRYKLEPFDKDWIDSRGARFASYNNLGRNTYTFMVQGSNDDGLWSDPATLVIKFKPHPLLSYWAFGAYIVLLGMGIYAFIRYRLVQQNNRLEEERRAKELEQAREFQMSLIPQSPPSHPDYDIAFHMKTSTEVGGDYYDFFPQEDGSMYVVCGDATGHGLNAGMMVSITKAGLYGSNFDTPAITTTRLNQTIKAIDLGTTRMSLNMAKFHNGSFDFTSAGMPPAYLYNGDAKTVEEILVPGLPLGSMKKADFDLHSFHLKSNDALVLISDGLPECVNHDGEMLDYDAVKNCVQSNGNKTAQGIVDSLINLGDNWMSGLLNDDDITLVVIKKK